MSDTIFRSLFKNIKEGYIQRYKIYIVILTCLVLICGCSQNHMDRPTAIKGVFNLGQWNLKKDGKIALDGEWEFFWHQLLTPDKIARSLTKDQNTFYTIPNTWNNHKINGHPLPGTGYATFALKIHASGLKNTPIALEIKEILTAYTLWINGRPVSSEGIVGTSKNASVPESQPTIIPFTLTGDTAFLVLQVSNYYHRRGGPWTSIYLGRADDIKKAASNHLFLNLFLVGSIFMMGLYHLSLSLLMKHLKSPLYFGIFCCLISIRSLVTNECYLHVLFPGLSWEILEKIEYLSFYISVPIFSMFCRSIFPEEFSKKALWMIQAAGIIFSALVILTPASIFTRSVNAYQLITLFMAGYLFYTLFRAFQMKREGAYVILTGFIILFITILNDILYVNEIIHTGSLIPVGMFFFIFSQAFLLSFIYSRSFKKVKNQKKALALTNTAFQKEIQVRKTLQANLIQSHEKFQKSRIALILGLAKLAEYRDEDTGTHLKRIREYSIVLAMTLSRLDRYKDYISPEYIDDIFQSAILHDIGKVGIKDAILLKPDKLTKEQFEVIKTHTTIGGDALTAIETEFSTKSFLTLGKNIAYSHHEKWDGTGYPKGLKQEAIPLSARIVAVADVYDALTSERPYKKAFSHTKAVEIITRGRAKHFDPHIVDAFLTLTKQFEKIRATYID